MKYSLSLWFLFLFTASFAQQDHIPVADNLVVEGIPPIPVKLCAEVKNYTESRSAALVDWNPTKRRC